MTVAVEVDPLVDGAVAVVVHVVAELGEAEADGCCAVVAVSQAARLAVPVVVDGAPQGVCVVAVAAT